MLDHLRRDRRHLRDQRLRRQARKPRRRSRPAGEALRFLGRTVAPDGSLAARARHLRAVVASGGDGLRELEQMRCERGAEIARCLDLDEDTAAAISHLDEHWNGGGYPAGLAGEDISPLARVMSLAQTMEVFWQQGGPQAACAVARERRGTWFDPALVDAVAAFEHEAAFWASLTNADVNALEPVDRVQRADDARLDRVAEAFAGIVDAKSPFTARHSAGVAAIAEGIADTMGLDAATRRLLRRAGLRVMGRDAGSKLDVVAFGALEAWLLREGARTLVDAA
jgi:HD domain